MKNVLSSIILLLLATGCATQPVKWTKTGQIDVSKGSKVAVVAQCKMPRADITYLQDDIQDQVTTVLKGNNSDTNAYNIKVTITKYDKGNAFARFMLIGLGQMYLYGTVDITQAEPPLIIREGEFKKNYCLGGFAGGFATMQNNVLPEVGKSIAEAIKPK